MKKIYRDEIKRLTEHPEKIEDTWVNGRPLFGYATPSGLLALRKDGRLCGCLTTIRACSSVAYDPALTTLIRRDIRIPLRPEDITPADLPVFAEWMERLDNHKWPEA